MTEHHQTDRNHRFQDRTHTVTINRAPSSSTVTITDVFLLFPTVTSNLPQTLGFFRNPCTRRSSTSDHTNLTQLLNHQALNLQQPSNNDDEAPTSLLLMRTRMQYLVKIPYCAQPELTFTASTPHNRNPLLCKKGILTLHRQLPPSIPLYPAPTTKPTRDGQQIMRCLPNAHSPTRRSNTIFILYSNSSPPLRVRSHYRLSQQPLPFHWQSTFH